MKEYNLIGRDIGIVVQADSFEDAIQKAVDYYLADNEEAGENKITNINVELKTSEDLEELGIEIYEEY